MPALKPWYVDRPGQGRHLALPTTRPAVMLDVPFFQSKAKFRDHVRSKTDTAMKNEVLCKFLCHNIVVVHQSQVELGIEPVFWGNEPAPESDPDILTLARPG